MDFNTQRKMIAAVMAFGKRTKIFYPLCLLAKYMIIFFCSLIRAVDMALSDDKGRFLGIDRYHAPKRKRKRVPVRTEKKYMSIARRAPRRGFFPRFLGGVLAAAFTFSILPAGLTIVSFAVSDGFADRADLSPAPEVGDTITNFASTVTDSTVPVYNEENTLKIKNDGSWKKIGDSAFSSSRILSSIDISGAESVGNAAFVNCPSLSTVIIDGQRYLNDPEAYFGPNEGAGSFKDIAPGATLIVRNETPPGGVPSAWTAVKIGVSGAPFIENFNGVFYSNASADQILPKNVSNVTVYPRVSDGSTYITFTTNDVSTVSAFKYQNNKFTNIGDFGSNNVAEITLNSTTVYAISLSDDMMSSNERVALKAFSTPIDMLSNEVMVYSDTFKFAEGENRAYSYDSEFTVKYNGLVPTVSWVPSAEEKVKDNIKYIVYTDENQKYNIKGKFDGGTGTVSTAELDKIVNNYNAYLLEVYDPLNQFDAHYQTDSDIAGFITKHALEIDGKKWNDNGEYFCYRVSTVPIIADQLVDVTGINVLRNTDCNNSITVNWEPVVKTVSGNDATADGYYIYIDGVQLANDDATPITVPGTTYTADVSTLSSGTHTVKVVAFRFVNGENALGGDKGVRDFTVDKFIASTESVNPNEIVVSWEEPIAKKYETGNMSYIITCTDSRGISDTKAVSGAKSYTFRPEDRLDEGKITIVNGEQYTFTVKQNCPDPTHEHFYESEPPTKTPMAQSTAAPEFKPVLTITDANREFKVSASLPEGTPPEVMEKVAGYHIKVYPKTGSSGDNALDKGGSPLHESYILANKGTAFEEIQTFNIDGTAPVNGTKYIVEVSAYYHSQHYNGKIYNKLPETPYNPKGIAYKPYPIEGSPSYEVASPINKLTLFVNWQNAEKPSDRGAKLTWSTIDEKAEFYRIRRRRIDDKASPAETEWVVLEPKQKAVGVGKNNVYVDNTANFAVYTPNPVDPNDKVDFYARFEYEVEAVYADGTADPIPASKEFQFETSDASLGTPGDVTAVGQDGQITITWVTTKAADAYCVYRDNETEPLIKLFADGKAGKTMTYIDHPMDNNMSHTYSVTAIYSVAENDSNDPNIRKLIESAKIKSNEGMSGDYLAPPNLSGTTKDSTITVTWDKIKGATYYEITYSKYNPATQEYENPTTVNVYENELTLSNLKNDDIYKFEGYSVKIVNNSPDKSDISVPCIVQVGTPLPAPIISADPGDESVTVTIIPTSKDAAGYNIYRKTENGEYEFIKQTTGTKYLDNIGLTNGVKYIYKVEAFKYVSGVQVLSPFSSEAWAIPGSQYVTPIPAPIVTPEPGNRSVTLTIVPMSKDTIGYNIYRRTENGTYEFVAQTPDETYIDLGLENGVKYYYQVEAFKYVGDKRVDSPPSAEVWAIPSSEYADPGTDNPNFIASPLDFTVTTSDGAATLSWAKVGDAMGYKVYIIDSSGSPVLVSTTSKPGITYNGLKNGEVYTYTVTAYKTNYDGISVESNFATPKSVVIGTYLAAPVDLTAVGGDRRVVLEWSAVRGATGYVVYAYNDLKNSFTAIGVVSKPGFVHEGLENGLTYSYMVAAYRTVGLTNQYSQYSVAVSATPYAPPPQTDNGNNNNNNNNNNNGNNNNNNNGNNNNNNNGGNNNNQNGNNNQGGSNSGGNNNPNVVPSDDNYRINIVGTIPEGMSHSELIAAYSDEYAFDQDIDIRFSVNTESSKVAYDTLARYANGLDSFDVFPIDISCYIAGTDRKVVPFEGHYVTITLPIPDGFRKYGEDVQLMHIRVSDNQMEIIPLNFGEAGGIPLVQFKCSDFSPFAFVHYYTPEDMASESGTAAGTGSLALAGSIYSFRCTSNGGFRIRKRNRVYKLIKKSR